MQCTSGLLNQATNTSYSKVLKISAVNDYLNGECSNDICLKYEIRSAMQLQRWIMVYNSGGLTITSIRDAYMEKARPTTLDERLKIIMECLANDKKYETIALKYQYSYQQVRNWVKQYIEMESNDLEDRRDMRTESLPSRNSRKNYATE